MVAGRQGGRAGWGVLAVTEPRDKDQVRGGRGVPSQVEVRGREDRKTSRLFDDADRTEQRSKEILQYQGAQPLGPLLRR